APALVERVERAELAELQALRGEGLDQVVAVEAGWFARAQTQGHDQLLALRGNDGHVVSGEFVRRDVVEQRVVAEHGLGSGPRRGRGAVPALAARADGRFAPMGIRLVAGPVATAPDIDPGDQGHTNCRQYPAKLGHLD